MLSLDSVIKKMQLSCRPTLEHYRPPLQARSSRPISACFHPTQSDNRERIALISTRHMLKYINKTWNWIQRRARIRPAHMAAITYRFVIVIWQVSLILPLPTEPAQPAATTTATTTLRERKDIAVITSERCRSTSWRSECLCASMNLFRGVFLDFLGLFFAGLFRNWRRRWRCLLDSRVAPLSSARVSGRFRGGARATSWSL